MTRYSESGPRTTRARIENRLRAVIEGRAVPGPVLGPTLAGLSRAHRLVLRLRDAGYQRGVFRVDWAACPVMAIGNIAAGGTGKSPMAVWAAQTLLRQGMRPAVLSRGYKSEREARGGVVTDGRRLLMSAGEAGDEPFMMAMALSGVPVLVGRNRCRSARLAVDRFDPDVLILDDAMQHRRFGRDADIVLLDARNPFGNGYLLPRGRLREPPSALGRASAIVFTRLDDDARAPALAEWGHRFRVPVFFCRHRIRLYRVFPDAGRPYRLSPEPAGALEGKRVVAFSGIADNPAFFAAVRELGAETEAAFPFPDHHPYTPDDCEAMTSLVRREAMDGAITTEKDLGRLGRNPFSGFPLWVAGVEIDFGADAAAMARFFLDAVAAGRERLRGVNPSGTRTPSK